MLPHISVQFPEYSSDHIHAVSDPSSLSAEENLAHSFPASFFLVCRIFYFQHEQSFLILCRSAIFLLCTGSFSHASIALSMLFANNTERSTESMSILAGTCRRYSKSICSCAIFPLFVLSTALITGFAQYCTFRLIPGCSRRRSRYVLVLFPGKPCQRLKMICHIVPQLSDFQLLPLQRFIIKLIHLQKPASLLQFILVRQHNDRPD